MFHQLHPCFPHLPLPSPSGALPSLPPAPLPARARQQLPDRRRGGTSFPPCAFPVRLSVSPAGPVGTFPGREAPGVRAQGGLAGVSGGLGVEVGGSARVELAHLGVLARYPGGVPAQDLGDPPPRRAGRSGGSGCCSQLRTPGRRPGRPGSDLGQEQQGAPGRCGTGPEGLRKARQGWGTHPGAGRGPIVSLPRRAESVDWRGRDCAAAPPGLPAR